MPLAASGLVQLRVNRPRRLCRNAGDPLELLLRRGDKALRGAEVLEQRAAAHRPDSLQLVEDRREGPRVPALPVKADREPVCLVANALQQLQAGRMRIEAD